MSVTKLPGLITSISFVLTINVMLFDAVIPAQQQGAATAKQDKQDMVAALKQSIAQNQAALKQYTWTEATEISLKGEVKKQELKECHYGPDGEVEKTEIQSSDQAQQEQQAGGRRRRSGPLKQTIVEHKKAELKEYMQQVAALIHEYVPPKPEKIQAAVTAGNVSIQSLPSQGVATLTFKDYLKEGDSLVLGFDANTKKISSFNVQSYLNNPKDDPVTLAVTFASLPDGTNYAQQSVVSVPAKNVEVKVTNYGYAKTGK
jgi:hypothetical protein